MGRMIIKNEDIKGDITIDITDNKFIAMNPISSDENNKENFKVSFNHGILDIRVNGCTIIGTEQLEDYKLKQEYLDSFLKYNK